MLAGEAKLALNVELMTDTRKQQLAAWASKTLSCPLPELAIVSGDASFRRYFRLQHENQSIIAVDAPPQHENNHAFVTVGQLLAEQGLLVPQFIATNFDNGFLLLSDLGDRLYLDELNQTNVDELYQKAIDALLKMQQIQLSDSSLPDYDKPKLTTELNLFKQWFIQRHLNITLTKTENQILEHLFEELLAAALAQKQVFVHRDFHSRNLMICDKRTPAIIDFQDAVKGPISYDLVSLLKDCYIQWPNEQVKAWCHYYYQQATQKQLLNTSFEAFHQHFDWMGLQRHIKVLGIFCRLNYRDGKPHYLNDLPLVFNYVLQTASIYPQFADFVELMQQKIQPAFEACQ